MIEEEPKEIYNQLTGAPLPDDLLLEAVPVCAPYSALTNYKYKIKLQPGNMKKGKILKSAIEIMVAQPDCTEKERELIKSLPDNVAILQVLGNCKIQAPGYLKIKSKKPSKK